MSLRPFILGFIAVVAVFLSAKNLAQAQTATNFAAWKEPQNADAVPNWARRIPRDFRDLTGTAREELLAQYFAALKEISDDSEVLPSTRYNAILAVGQLESASGNPPTAYPAALLYLIEVYQHEDSPLYLKYGALLGIVRHAILGIDSEQQDNVIDLLLETVSTQSMPTEMDVWDWFRLTALDGLSALKTVGAENKAARELLTMINHKSQKLNDLYRKEKALTREENQYVSRLIELASKAAKTLGDLDFKSASDIDAKAITDAFIALTRAVCDIKCKTATDSTFPQVVVHVKICTHSVVWGMRGGLLTGRPTENSFYASLESESPEKKRLDVLMAEIVELTTFFDEGEKEKRAVALPNSPKEFRFNLFELHDVLKKCSAALDAAPPL